MLQSNAQFVLYDSVDDDSEDYVEEEKEAVGKRDRAGKWNAPRKRGPDT